MKYSMDQKKITIKSGIAILLIAMLFTMTACTTGNSQTSIGNISESTDILKPFNIDGTITETVIYDENNLKIIAKSLNYTSYSAELTLVLENNSDSVVSFVGGSIGFCQNFVNGYMVTSGYINETVEAHSSVEETVNLTINELRLSGISEIASLGIGIQMSDDDYNVIDQTTTEIQTSLYSSHNNQDDQFITVINNKIVRNTLGYELLDVNNESIYSDSMVDILSYTIIKNSDSEINVVLEVLNKSEAPIVFQTTDIMINDVLCYDHTWNSTRIIPDKKAIVFVKLNSIIEYASEEIEQIDVLSKLTSSICIKDEDAHYVLDQGSITIDLGDITISSEEDLK